MRILVIGTGEVGYNIAAKLAREKIDVVVIDKDEDRLRQVADTLDVQVIRGSGANPATLAEAQVASADLLVAVTNSDETNILACRLAQLMAPETRRVARVRSGGYYENLTPEMRQDGLGIGFIINPGREAVDNIMDFLEVPGAVDVIDVAKGRLKLVGIRLPDGHPLVDKTLAESYRRDEGNEMLIAAIYRNHDLVIPRGDTVLKSGDLLYMAAASDDLSKVMEFSGLKIKPVKSLMIVGGGELGYQLAKRLETEKSQVDVKLVEMDQARCEFLSSRLEKTIIFKGDGTDQSLLQEENAGDCDVFVAVTTDDEKNMISCLLAQRLGARHTITRVNRSSYAPLVSAIGLETLISVRVAAVSGILKHIRRGRVLSVATLKSEDAELIEFEVSVASPVAGHSLMKASFPAGTIVAALTRGPDMIIPKGDTIIEAGDILVVVAKAEAIGKVEEILSPTPRS